MIPKVEIEPCLLIDNSYTRNGYSWSALSLIETAKDLPEFDVPLASINLDISYWPIHTLADFIYHAKRTEVTDEQHPILFDNFGNLCDGAHRVCKAILAGKETIKAKRIVNMPSYDRYEKPETEK